MSLENANTTEITTTNNENNNVVETNNNTVNNNVVAIEPATDITDDAVANAAITAITTSTATATTPTTAPTTAPILKTEAKIVLELEPATTIATSTDDVNVEPLEINNENETKISAIEMSNNMSKNTVETTKAIAVVPNGENNGIASKMSIEKTGETTTTIHALPTKQQERLVMGDPAIQGDENTSNKGKMDNDAALINFKVLYLLTQLCGLTMIILVGSWIGIHMGGFGGTDNPGLEFNWHPFLMTIGLIFLYGNSILVYRGFRTTRKKTLKITHASIHMGAFILTVIALKTVFDSHNLAVKPIPNLYSLHSWLGLAAVIIFCMQYVAGFMAYMVPGLKEQYKIAYMPLHIYFGLFGFVLAIASALMGFTEKAIFSVPNYSSLPNSGVIVNLCGVLFVIFGGLVVYLTTEPSYKRRPVPEDTVLLTGVNE